VLEAIHRNLKPGGEAYLVANQFLDYPALARKVFAETALIARDQSYTIHRMVKASSSP
jgi:16S rRNA G1207 methylase RsmC